MRNLLYAATAIAALTFAATAAKADLVIGAFGQTSGGVVATNPTASTTHIQATDVPVQITQILGNAVPPGTFGIFSLSADSDGPAGPAFGQIGQNFSGTFSIITAMTLENFLSGSFVDAAVGAGGSLTLNASNGGPGESVSFTSDFALIQAAFNDPLSLSLSFAAVTPNVNLLPIGCTPGTNCTIAAFDAAVSGVFSGNVPEPASLAVFGTALVALGLLGRRRNRGSKTDVV